MAVLKHRVQDPDSKLAQARVASKTGRYVIKWGEGAFGEVLIKLAVSLRNELLGSEHALTLESMGILARLLWSNSRFKGAEKLFEGLINTLTRTEGLQSQRRLRVMVSLATNHTSQGLFKEAGEVQMEVLNAQRKALGEWHTLVLSVMCRMGSIFVQQELWIEAEDMYTQALEKKQAIVKTQGTDAF